MQSSSAEFSEQTATKSASGEVAALLLSLVMPPSSEETIGVGGITHVRMTNFGGGENLFENGIGANIKAHQQVASAPLADEILAAVPTPQALFAGFASGNETIAAFAMGTMRAATAVPCQSVNDALAAAPFNDWTTQPYVLFLFAALYTLVLTVGITGNVCVVMAVARTRSLRTASNWFILMLSCSDIAACLISGTITPITAFRKECESNLIAIASFDNASLCVINFSLLISPPLFFVNLLSFADSIINNLSNPISLSL